MSMQHSHTRGVSRRKLLASGMTAGAAAAMFGTGDRTVQAAVEGPGAAGIGEIPDTADLRRALYARPLPPGLPGRDYMPVEAPNSGMIPWKIMDGVKVFHLVAMEVWNEFCPGLKALCWGYNGMIHPVLEALQGERVRIYVTNRLPEATTTHWHGVYVPCGMDGLAGLTQKAIPPGETYMYEFNLVDHGTKMFHSHFDEMTQIGLGMTGLFIIHPRNPAPNRTVDRDFAIMLHEWRIDPGAWRPNPLEMTDFNVFTMNAKSFPATHPLVVRTGQKVRIRLGNLGPMDHHPIHLHNYSFQIVASDGGEYPPSAWQPATTVLVPVGTTRTVEFVASNPGDWAMHCHMTHHVMTQMGHNFPNMIGVKPGRLGHQMRKLLPDYMTMGQTGMGMTMGMPSIPNSAPMLGGKGPHGLIDMGGMFTILKVRDGITAYQDPGWYRNPPGELALNATAADMQRDGIDPRRIPAPVPGPSSPAASPEY